MNVVEVLVMFEGWKNVINFVLLATNWLVGWFVFEQGKFRPNNEFCLCYHSSCGHWLTY